MPAELDVRRAGPQFDDDDLVTISALEHWSYCPRQCGLIHLEATFDENLYTLRGRRLHERVHEPGADWEDGIRRVRGMPLFSLSLGLTGKADLVEFHGETPFPVEYKTGPTRDRRHEALQLCAQAMCLEEMLGVVVPAGAIFAHGSRKRTEIRFDDELRARVPEAVQAVRAMLAGTVLPPAPNDSRCPRCSLFDACLPSVVEQDARIRGFFGELFHPMPTEEVL